MSDTTPEKLSLRKRIQRIRVELARSGLSASGRNTYSNFSYFELSDFLPRLNELMDEHDLMTRFSIEGACKITNQEGVTKHLPEMAHLWVCDARSGEAEEFKSPTAETEIGKKRDGSGGAEPIQNLGGKMTYMRRYLLIIAFEIVENDAVDVGQTAIEKPSTQRVADPPQPPKQTRTYVNNQLMPKLGEPFNAGGDTFKLFTSKRKDGTPFMRLVSQTQRDPKNPQYNLSIPDWESDFDDLLNEWRAAGAKTAADPTQVNPDELPF